MDSLFGRSTHPYGLLLAADARAEGWSSALHSALRRGEIAKVRPGAYLGSRRWNDLAPLQRYLVRIHAVGLTFRSPLFSHQSAAALHGLPLLDRRADRIHLRATTPRGSGSRGDVTVHVGKGDPDVMECHGLRLTSPARTIMDLARTLPHGEALALADAAIRPRRVEGAIRGTDAPLCTKAELIDLAQEGITSRGGWNAYLAISEADPLSGSLGESMARSLIMRLGAPPPALQAALRDERGLIGYADFFWPQLGVVGEFDGPLKYGADNRAERRPRSWSTERKCARTGSAGSRPDSSASDGPSSWTRPSGRTAAGRGRTPGAIIRVARAAPTGLRRLRCACAARQVSR